MRLTALLCFFATGVFAQSPTDVFDQAPPEIDKALRERVAIFFQAHVDGKFRRAEQVILEDSLDDFYNSEKTKLIRFEISKIAYSEKFTKATVICDVELDWITSKGKIRVKPPMKSLWKVDKGQWWWYAPPKGIWETPFGVMKSENSAADASSMTNTPAPSKYVDPNELLNKVVADKNEVQLDTTKHSEDTATISSEVPGNVQLAVRPHGVPGLTVKIDNENIGPGKPGVIHFIYDPPADGFNPIRIVYIHANPLNKVFSFTLNFRQPPRANPAPNFPGQPPVMPKKP